MTLRAGLLARLFSCIFLPVTAILLATPVDVPAQTPDAWCVFEKTACSPLCRINSRNDWLIVAHCNEPVETTGSPCGVQRVPENQPGMDYPTAMALRNLLVVTGRRYENACCRDYTLWLSQDRSRLVCMESGANPGPGWLTERGRLCYDECLEETGQPTVVRLLPRRTAVRQRGRWTSGDGEPLRLEFPTLPPITLPPPGPEAPPPDPPIAPPDRPTPPATTTLAVLVLDSRNGSPITNATVTVGGSSRSSAPYTFSGLPRGSHIIDASASGYRSARLTTELSGASEAITVTLQKVATTQTGPCWTRKEPKIESEYDARWAGKEKNHAFTYSASGFTLTVTNPEGKSFSNTVSWSAPPPSIRPGEPIEVSITSSGNEEGAHAHGGFRGLGTMVASMRGWGRQKSGKLTFTTTPAVEASGGSWVGTGEIPWAHVRVTWEYVDGCDAGTSAGGSGGTGTNPGATRLCDRDRDRVSMASARARLANLQLARLRAGIRQLDRAWSDVRDTAAVGALVDLAFLAFPSLSSAPEWQIVEASVKGMVKEVVKQYTLACVNEGLTPEQALQVILQKGYDNAQKKALELLLTDLVTRGLLGLAVNGTSAAEIEEALRAMSLPAGSNVDAPMPPGTPRIDMQKELRDQYVKDYVKFLGFAVSLSAAVANAREARAQMESIRVALAAWRDEEIATSRESDRWVRELDVAQTAYQYCLTLHPEERNRPLPKANEPQPPSRKSVEDNSTLVVGPLRLSLEVGDWVVGAVPAGSIYAIEGLVPGAILVSVDDTPVSGLATAQLRARLAAGSGEMKMLGFQLPDGRIVHVPAY